MRINDKVVSRGVLIVIGVGEDGYREIISVDIANTETKESWSRIFRRLKERGLKGVKLIVSDNHKGLRGAINRYFQEALWQRCQFHFTQNLLDHISKKNKGTLRNKIQCIFNSPDIQSASLRAREMVEKYKDIYPGFTERLEEGIDDALSCFHFPSSHRRKIRTTNTLERFNEEIRRRTRVVRIFPDEASCLRLICALCIEKSEEWITKKRYMRMDVLYQDTQEIPELEGALISV